MSNLTDEFLKWLPKHKGELILQHNPHRSEYADMPEWMRSFDHHEWSSPEDQKQALVQDDFWTMTWYPDSPVGFHAIASSKLEKLLLFAHDARFRSDGDG